MYQEVHVGDRAETRVGQASLAVAGAAGCYSAAAAVCAHAETAAAEHVGADVEQGFEFLATVKPTVPVDCPAALHS